MLSDEELVRQFQHGDPGAFDELVERHRRPMYSLVCRLASPAEADDLAQDVFLAAYHALPRFRGESAFRTWIYRIAVHICSHHLRRRRPAAAELDDSHADSRRAHDPLGRALSDELQHHVRRSINALPQKLKAVVVLRDLHQLSYQEIAAVVGCPIGTVRSRLHYATERLAAALQPYVEAS